MTYLPQVSLPKIGSSGEYSPLKFSLRDNTVDYLTGKTPAQKDTHVFVLVRPIKHKVNCGREVMIMQSAWRLSVK